MKRIFKIPALLAIAICMIFSMVSCSSYRDPVIAECNGLKINKSTFLLKMAEAAMESYNGEKSTEDIESIKNKAIESLKTYTLYKQGYKDSKYTLSEEDRSTLRSSILESLIAMGLKYDETKRDEIFIDAFGVSYEQYMVYHEELTLSEYYFNKKLEEIDVADERVTEYFLKNKDKYMSCKADVIYIEGETSEEIAEAIRNKLLSAVSLKSIETDFSQYIRRSGTFVIDNTSNIDKYFGDGFKREIRDSDVNDVIVFKTESGITIARNLEISGYEENKEDIIKLIREDIFTETVKEEISGDNYRVNIDNQKIYDEISAVPGIDT